MIRKSRAHTLTADELAVLRRPREDLLVETATGEDCWSQEHGPFAVYERKLQVTRADEAADRFEVTETIESRLAIPVPLWRWIFQRPMANALANLDRRPRSRWWRSRDPVSATTVELLSQGFIETWVGGEKVYDRDDAE